MYKMEVKEKSTNRTIRRALRVLAYTTLVFEIVFGLVVPRIKGVKVDFVPDEWYLILGSVALLVSIEAIKKAVDAYVAKKSAK